MTASGSEVKGKCLCGAVKFEAHVKSQDIGACHCEMCRRWSSGPFLCVECAEPPQIEGVEDLSVYQSSDWGERCFCSKCGSTLFWRTRDGSHFMASAGALENSEGLRMTHEIFVDEKPDYYDFANETKKMTGAEVFAAFSSGADNN